MGCGSYRLYSCPGIFFLGLIKAYGLAKSLPLFNDKNIDAGVFYCNGQRYAVSPGNRKWETPAACFQSSGSEFEAGGNNKCWSFRMFLYLCTRSGPRSSVDRAAAF